jgi:hypothetical protein
MLKQVQHDIFSFFSFTTQSPRGEGKSVYLLTIPAVEQKRDGAVIDEVDLHLGLKLSGLDRDTLFSYLKDQLFVESFGFGGFFCVGKRGPSPFSAVAIESKLGDHQHLSPDLPEGKIELSGGIFEYSQVRKLGNHVGDVLFSIALTHTQEDQKALADLSSNPALNINSCRFHPLDDRPHKTSMPNLGLGIGDWGLGIGQTLTPDP